jgi:hypothetical protein
MTSSEQEPDNSNNNIDDSDDVGVRRTSQLLLAGWTMLADHCPRAGCHVKQQQKSKKNSFILFIYLFFSF